MFVVYDVFRIMTFVAYDVCRIMTFVALWRLSFMTFVALWCLSNYDICHIMTFVVYDVCRIMMFVALWRQLWRLSLIGFVAVSYSLLWIVLYIVVYGEYGCGGCGCSIESFILYKLCGAEIIYFRLRLLFQHSGLCRLCFFYFPPIFLHQCCRCKRVWSYLSGSGRSG